MSPEFTPYVGESQQTSRDILNRVRKLIWLRDTTMQYADFGNSKEHQQLAAGYFASARNEALEYIANAGHGDINTINRLARLVAPAESAAPASESPDPYKRGWQHMAAVATGDMSAVSDCCGGEVLWQPGVGVVVVTTKCSVCGRPNPMMKVGFLR